MKKTSIFLLLFLSVLLSDTVRGQNFRLGAEFGYDAFFGDTQKPGMVRETHSSTPSIADNYDYPGLFYDMQMLQVLYMGLKTEFFTFNNRLGIAAGLRFSNYRTTFDSDRDYFLWQTRQEGVNTDYVRIRDIAQSNRYLGIPLEIRIIPKKRDRPVLFYVKLGGVFNYRLHTKNTITFFSEAMNHYTETIENQIEATDDFNAYLYPAAGLKIGRGQFPWFNIEAHFPGVMFTKRASSFVKSNFETGPGIGLQFSIQFSSGKNSSIGSK